MSAPTLGPTVGPTEEVQLPAPRRAGPPVSNPVGGRVVVADDDVVTRALVACQLTRSGATVVEVTDGAEALTACRRRGVELAILDIEMPNLTGFDVLEALRADPATSDMPVLLLTGHVLEGGVAKGLGLGAHDYIRKPFALAELQARVDAAILLGRRTRELAESEAAFRGLFEGSHTAMSIVGLDGGLRRVNAGWVELLGRPADSIDALDTYSLVHPDDRAVYSQALVDMRRRGVDHDRGRLRLVRPDGETRWCEVSTTLVRDRENAPAYLYRVMVDVTDEVLNGQALLESERRYRELVARVARERAAVADEEGLELFADHDPLTGLLNPHGLEAALRHQAATVARHGPAGALLVVKLDNFRQVLDTRGAGVGDDLITWMSDLLLRTMGETAALARLGRDQFAVVLPHASREEADHVARRLVAAVPEGVAEDPDSVAAPTVSVGIAMFEDPKLSGDAVLARADLAMFAAHRAGGNRVAFDDDRRSGRWRSRW